ncbi:slit homolog 1 protein-like [Bombus pascuorum]|uniref:slit homolog 1 protein-like n=1 Tax=Bombus pascuorum TaxID=65598 RepID=UPI0021315AC7|nr:slit homolog 1 protein-like [Bombus pascuorum]
MIIYLNLIGLYFSLIIQSSTCDICSTCSCTILMNKEQEINCHGKYLGNNDMFNFDLLTLDNYQVLYKLVLSKNNIVNLPTNLLKKLQSLRSLDLSENIIEEIYTTMFIDLKNLEDLNLSKNALRIFDDSLLEVLPALLSLDLSYNHINSIEYLMNKTTTKINTLDLSHNNISSLSKIFLESLINLQYLDLSFNRIHSLEDCSLTVLNSLKTIHINNNFIITLNMQALPKTLTELYSGYNQISEILYNLDYIEVLNLQHNNICELHANIITDNLQHLNISGNMLSSFPNVISENLKVLDISNNKLSYVPEVISIKNFPLLLHFDVSQNPIENLTISSDLKLNSFIASKMSMLKAIDESTLANLRPPSNGCIHLTLSNNKMLSFIHKDALRHMTLCSLDLSNNQLSYIAKELVVRNNNSMIYNVNLQRNPFKCNCTLQWMLSDLVPQLYSIQPHLLDDLRCASPPEMSNIRMVHWYGWKDEIFCVNTSVFKENLAMNVANVISNEVVHFDSSTGLLVVVGIATTVLTLLIVGGILWTQRITIRKRRVNRKF